MAHPRVVHADAVPPTLREAAYLLNELMDGRAVLAEQLCEQIVQCMVSRVFGETVTTRCSLVVAEEGQSQP